MILIKSQKKEIEVSRFDALESILIIIENIRHTQTYYVR